MDMDRLLGTVYMVKDREPVGLESRPDGSV